MDRLVVIVAAAVTAVASVFAVTAAVTSDDDSGPVAAPGATSPPASSDALPVEIRDFAFGPPEAAVPAGSQVVWTNADGLAHSVVAEDGTFASPNLGGGESFPFTFSEPGTYLYFCGIHDTMRGAVVVEG